MPAIRLVPLAGPHLDGLAALAEDPDILRFTRIPEPPPPDFAPRWLDQYEEGRRQGTCDGFAIVDAEAATFLGVGVAPRIDQQARTVELGYIVAPAARGRGVATGALRLLTGWAFSEFQACRLELLINVENEASKRVAQRCGYLKEGVLRSLHVKEGRRADCEIWSRLPSDPGVW